MHSNRCNKKKTALTQLDKCYHGKAIDECLCGNSRAQPGQYCCAKYFYGGSPAKEWVVSQDSCAHPDCTDGQVISQYGEDKACYCGNDLIWDHADPVVCCNGKFKVGRSCPSPEKCTYQDISYNKGDELCVDYAKEKPLIYVPSAQTYVKWICGKDDAFLRSGLGDIIGNNNYDWKKTEEKCDACCTCSFKFQNANSNQCDYDESADGQNYPRIQSISTNGFSNCFIACMDKRDKIKENFKSCDIKFNSEIDPKNLCEIN